MSSGEDWTHHWLMTNMGPSGSDTIGSEALPHQSSSSYEAEYHSMDPALSGDPLGMTQIQTSGKLALSLIK